MDFCVLCLGCKYGGYRSSQKALDGRGHSTIPPFHSTIPFHRSIPPFHSTVPFHRIKTPRFKARALRVESFSLATTPAATSSKIPSSYACASFQEASMSHDESETASVSKTEFDRLMEMMSGLQKQNFNVLHEARAVRREGGV